jgi:periplasmic protein TonB
MDHAAGHCRATVMFGDYLAGHYPCPPPCEETRGRLQVIGQRRSQVLAVVSSIAVHGGLGAALIWSRPAPAPAAEPVAMSVSLLPSSVISSSARADEGSPKSPAAKQGSPDSPPPPDQLGHAGAGARAQASAADGPTAALAAKETSNGPRGDQAPEFEAALLAHIERFRRYPDDARRERQQGVVMVGFAMDRRGDLLDLWVDQSSGFADLDAEAMSTLKRAQPLPLIPKGLPDELQIILPVAFALR